MNWKFSVFLIAIVGLGALVSADADDVSRTAPEVIQSRGYDFESHAITTSDGYILTAFRIFPRLTSTSNRVGVAVLHAGFTCSCFQYLIADGDNPLPFQLVNAGYEVWLGNFRGTTYGSNHTSLKLGSQDFWRFSFDEFGLIDIPETVEYARSVSGTDKVVLVGHSEAATAGFVALSSNADLRRHVSVFVALSPAVFMQNTQSKLVLQLKNMIPIFKLFGIHEFASSDFVNAAANSVCRFNPDFCSEVVCWAGGCNSTYSLSVDRLPVLLSHYPDTTSVQDMEHWLQIYRTNEFRKFDYGKSENRKRYGSDKSPLYDLGNIDVPTLMFTGTQDLFVNTKDTEKLIQVLKDLEVPVEYLESFPYGHGDFIWSDNAAVELYPKILKLLKQYPETLS